MKSEEKTLQLFDTLIKKASLKQTVYKNSLQGLNLLKEVMEDLTKKYEEVNGEDSGKIPFIYKDRGKFEAEMKFGGDTLVFMMHTNVFELPRTHEVMKADYIKKDKERSYCGIINIFNFLSDSFKYNRLNDVGYLIGRIFINKDNHCFIEGKKEIGYLFSNFGTSKLDEKMANDIIESSIYYTVNFDLLTPPYDQIKYVTVQEFRAALDPMQIKTGKRLGFKFQADME